MCLLCLFMSQSYACPPVRWGKSSCPLRTQTNSSLSGAIGVLATLRSSGSLVLGDTAEGVRDAAGPRTLASQLLFTFSFQGLPCDVGTIGRQYGIRQRSTIQCRCVPNSVLLSFCMSSPFLHVWCRCEGCTESVAYFAPNVVIMFLPCGCGLPANILTIFCLCGRCRMRILIRILFVEKKSCAQAR